MSIKKPIIQYSSTKLDIIIEKIKNGEIKIPPFQRTFDWSAKDMARFYNSIVDGEPFGSIMLWNDSSNEVIIKQTNNYFNALSKNKTSNSSRTYLIDGQQRLTTFIMLYLQHNQTEFKTKYLTKSETLFFDIKDFKFYSGKPKATSFNAHHFFQNNFKDLKKFIRSEIISNYWNELTDEENEEVFDNIKDIYTSFNDISIGKTEVYSNSLDEVINIFTLINTKGKRLNAFNIVHAYFILAGYDLDGEFQKIINFFKKKNWGEFSKPQLLILAYSAMHNTISNNDILNSLNRSNDQITTLDLEINYIKEDFKNDLKEMVHILRKELSFPRIDFIPSGNIMNILIRIIKYNKENEIKMYATDFNILREWVKLAIINDRYVSGSEGIKLPGYKEDVETIVKALKDKKSITNIEKARWIKTTKFDYKEIKYENYNSNSATYKYIISMMINHMPSFLTGSIVELKSIVKMKDLNIHHIFPYGNKKYSDHEFINSIANLTPLEQGENIDINNESPAIYIKDMIQNNKITNNNLEQCLIDSKNLNDISVFIENRSKKIAKLINQINNLLNNQKE